MKTIRLIELFAGYGSQALALKRLGLPFEHYRVVEFDKYAIKSYNAIHNTDFNVTDIRDVKGGDLGTFEDPNYTYLLTYSFPCTDLSLAGNMQGMKKGSGTRSGLLWEVERLLREINEAENLRLPQVLLMENVPQVHSEQNIKDFGEWITFLDSLGYVSKWQDLNAKDYGVAQNRERCFMVSYLDKSLKFAFPAVLNLKKYAPDYLEYVVNDKYYMNFETLNTILNNEIIEDINKGDVKKVKKLQRFSRSLGLYNASIGLVDFTTKESRLKTVANCITARPATIKTHQTEGNAVLYDTGTNYFIRKLTPLECLRLMDVDDEDAYKMLAANSETQVYKQAGNSIVVAVMVAIFKNLFLGGSEKEKTQIDIFDILE